MSVKKTKKSNSFIFSAAIIILIILAGYIYWLSSTGRLTGFADQVINKPGITTTLLGHVHNDLGNDLGGVTINIQDNLGNTAAQGTTGSDGNFTFGFSHPAQYQYKAVFNKSGYVPKIIYNLVFDTARYDFGTIVLVRISQAKGKIHGYVFKVPNTPVGGAEVTITSPRGDNELVLTNYKGYYSKNKLGIGLFYVRASIDPYNESEDQIKTVTLGFGETKQVDFTFP